MSDDRQQLAECLLESCEIDEKGPTKTTPDSEETASVQLHDHARHRDGVPERR